MVLPSPPPSSPISSSSSTPTYSQLQDHVSLPEQVDGLIAKICLEQGIDPPDNRARFELYQLGEDVSMDILRKIEKSKVRKSFSALLMHLANINKSAGPGNTQGSPGREGSYFRGPSVRGESYYYYFSFVKFKSSSNLFVSILGLCAICLYSMNYEVSCMRIIAC